MADKHLNTLLHDLRMAREILDQTIASEVTLQNVSRAADAIVAALKQGRKLMLCGNGGSAADAQHIAAEFVSRFNFDREPLAAIALTTDTSILTAIGNDYGYEKLFSRQLGAWGHAGDVLIGITTSGRSPNVLQAMELAKRMGITTISFTGGHPAPIDALADISVKVPSSNTPLVQQMHITLGHSICAIAERQMFDKDRATE